MAVEWEAGSCWPGQLSPHSAWALPPSGCPAHTLPSPYSCWSLFPSLIFPTPFAWILRKPVAMGKAGAALIHLPVEHRVDTELTDRFRREGEVATNWFG